MWYQSYTFITKNLETTFWWSVTLNILLDLWVTSNPVVRENIGPSISLGKLKVDRSIRTSAELMDYASWHIKSLGTSRNLVASAIWFSDNQKTVDNQEPFVFLLVYGQVMVGWANPAWQ